MENTAESFKLHDMDSETPSRDPRTPAADVLAGLGREYLDECRTLAAAFVSDRDAEDLHQIRVRLRRMESLLRYSELNGELQPVTDLRRRTNSIRNVDVLLEREADFRGMIDSSEERCFNGTFEELRRRRVGLAGQAAELLAEPMMFERFAQLRQVLAAVPEGLTEDGGGQLSIGSHVRQVIAKANHKFSVMAGRIGDRSTDEEFHRLRIRAKRMRYNAELLGPWNPDVDTGVMGRYARDLQTLLGEFTDLCYQESAFRELERDPAVGCPLQGIRDYIILRKGFLRREVTGVLSAWL